MGGPDPDTAAEETGSAGALEAWGGNEIEAEAVDAGAVAETVEAATEESSLADELIALDTAETEAEAELTALETTGAELTTLESAEDAS